MAKKAGVVGIVVGQEKVVRSYSIYPIKVVYGGKEVIRVAVTDEKKMGIVAGVIASYLGRKKIARYEVKKGEKTTKRESRGVTLDKAVKRLEKEIRKYSGKR